MDNFYNVHDVHDLEQLIQKANGYKVHPLKHHHLGAGKLLVLLFFNPSLRTKLSTQKAAMNLGMQVISMDMKDSWAWEFQEGVVMNKDKAEHVKEAAKVISSYADIIAIRSFPSLTDKEADYQDKVIKNFIAHSDVPVINLESAIRHPLQSCADLMTIKSHVKKSDPKIVLSWAPHPKALPQAVSNSFLEWMKAANYKVTITHPEGYNLDPLFTEGHTVVSDQLEAFKDADIIYVKNWSPLSNYGQVVNKDGGWMITKEKLDLTNHAKLLHCLPVRRNVVISDDAMDSDHSAIQELAENRLYTAQAVISEIIK